MAALKNCIGWHTVGLVCPSSGVGWITVLKVVEPRRLALLGLAADHRRRLQVGGAGWQR